MIFTPEPTAPQSSTGASLPAPGVGNGSTAKSAALASVSTPSAIRATDSPPPGFGASELAAAPVSSIQPSLFGLP